MWLQAKDSSPETVGRRRCALARARSRLSPRPSVPPGVPRRNPSSRSPPAEAPHWLDSRYDEAPTQVSERRPAPSTQARKAGRQSRADPRHLPPAPPSAVYFRTSPAIVPIGRCHTVERCLQPAPAPRGSAPSGHLKPFGAEPRGGSQHVPGALGGVSVLWSRLVRLLPANKNKRFWKSWRR
ncbi:tripartite motif-containing protein 59 isoform X2 [Sapajus apella]|uniref:Tripartite motif-containing protein 59 isoform X2 n=1 Tax=Sapajus apella TaxID=9515 RepID=A0A6J3GIN7_SAPAP|nr:tripartite motif-containing protein 59 isoform X2 [Sapajus apella]